MHDADNALWVMKPVRGSAMRHAEALALEYTPSPQGAYHQAYGWQDR